MVGMSQCSVPSRAGHVTTETVFRQMLALLRLGDGDEHLALESDTTGLNVMGNLYLYLIILTPLWGACSKVHNELFRQILSEGIVFFPHTGSEKTSGG